MTNIVLLDRLGSYVLGLVLLIIDLIMEKNIIMYLDPWLDKTTQNLPSSWSVSSVLIYTIIILHLYAVHSKEHFQWSFCMIMVWVEQEIHEWKETPSQSHPHNIVYSLKRTFNYKFLQEHKDNNLVYCRLRLKSTCTDSSRWKVSMHPIKDVHLQKWSHAHKLLSTWLIGAMKHWQLHL